MRVSAYLLRPALLPPGDERTLSEPDDRYVGLSAFTKAFSITPHAVSNAESVVGRGNGTPIRHSVSRYSTTRWFCPICTTKERIALKRSKLPDSRRNSRATESGARNRNSQERSSRMLSCNTNATDRWSRLRIQRPNLARVFTNEVGPVQRSVGATVAANGWCQ